MLGRAELYDHRAQQWLTREIERTARLLENDPLCCHVLVSRGGGRDGELPEGSSRHAPDELHRLAAADGERRVQDLVSGNDSRETRFECDEVEESAHPEQHRHMVHGSSGGDLLEHPHAALSKRERKHRSPLLRYKIEWHHG